MGMYTARVLGWLPFSLATLLALYTLIMPEMGQLLLRKEGLAEHVSHAILATTAIVWMATALRVKQVAPAVVCLCAIVYGLEEISYGGIYIDGWSHINFHNSLGGHSYSLFAAPVVALLGLNCIAKVRTRPWFKELVLTRSEMMGLLAIAGLVLLPALHSAWPESAIDELVETGIYLWMLLIGLRPSPRARG